MPGPRSQVPSILKQTVDLSGLASLNFPCPPNMRVVILEGTLKYATNPGSLDHALLLLGSSGVIDSGATYENQWIVMFGVAPVATQTPGFTHGMQIGYPAPADASQNFSYQRLEIHHTADANYKTLHGTSYQPIVTPNPYYFLVRSLWKSLLVVDTFQIQAMAGTTFAAGSSLRVTGVR